MAEGSSNSDAQMVPDTLGTMEIDAQDGRAKSPSAGDGDPGAKEKKKNMESPRAEIDTSAPFESVKEAASRFGGIGFWRPHKLSEVAEQDNEVLDITKVEEQALLLEKDLIAKERETLDVLKELESTKNTVEELKLKLQKETSEMRSLEESEKENRENLDNENQNSATGPSLCPSSAPGFILMELKQAKLNLARTTSDLADIRATVETYNKKIEKERISLEKTRQRLSLNSSKISSLEEELSMTKIKLQSVQDVEAKGSMDNAIDISKELQQLSCEAEQYKKMGEAAKSQVSRTMSQIEQTNTQIKTAKIRLVAAKKMKDAARAAEAVALAEIKAMSSSQSLSGVFPLNLEGVTLSYQEYTSLTSKARDAEEASKKRIMDAMLLVDQANLSKMEILKRVEEATEEVKSSKKVLEEALNRVEAANTAKLAVEEALRKWRSDHGHRRRSVQNSTKFKNSYPSHHRKDPRLLDVNGLNLVNDEPRPVLRPTLSIGQILSRKLLLTEEYENGVMVHREKGSVKQKVSLGQMLSKPTSDASSARSSERENGSLKQLPAKRKKFGFARFSVLMRKQSKKKKKIASNFRCRSE